MAELLIDGDVLIYRACWSVQYNEYGNEELGWFRHKKSIQEHLSANYEKEEVESLLPTIETRQILEPLSHAVRNFDAMIESSVRDTGAQSYVVCLSGDKNFRKEVKYPVKYKGNRPPKPTYYYDILTFVKSTYPTLTFDHLEADDVIGIMATKNPDSTIICTIDKDLDQIPGPHYNPVTKEQYVVSPREAKLYFYEQMLTGDRVDNIIGLPKVGPVTANKILDGVKDEADLEGTVVGSYIQAWGEEKGLDMYRANEQLLRIKTYDNQVV